jgi:N-acetylglucosamine-6-phosphate deacetylase
VRLGVGAAFVDGELVPGDVEVDGGLVRAVGVGDGDGSAIAVPGFVDLHVNGFAGVDFAGADAAGYARAGEALLRAGVTAYRPTFITSSREHLVEALRGVPSSRSVLGAHLEGPFLAEAMLRVHPAEHRRDPDGELLGELLAAGPVAQVTLAPELPGALELVDRLVARGVTVAAGHSDATAEQAHAGFDRGVSTVVHLFNAMRAPAAREPGLAGAALARDGVVVQLIADGTHVADDLVRLAFAAAPGRVALVTDAVAEHALGSLRITVEDGVARGPDGRLAGGTSTLDAVLRRVHALGIPLEAALGAVTTVPGRLARRGELGVLRPGGAADLAVLDDRLEVQRVLLAGVDAL